MRIKLNLENHWAVQTTEYKYSKISYLPSLSFDSWREYLPPTIWWDRSCWWWWLCAASSFLVGLPTVGVEGISCSSSSSSKHSSTSSEMLSLVMRWPRLRRYAPRGRFFCSLQNGHESLADLDFDLTGKAKKKCLISYSNRDGEWGFYDWQTQIRKRFDKTNMESAVQGVIYVKCSSVLLNGLEEDE